MDSQLVETARRLHKTHRTEIRSKFERTDERVRAIASISQILSDPEPTSQQMISEYESYLRDAISVLNRNGYN